MGRARKFRHSYHSYPSSGVSCQTPPVFGRRRFFCGTQTDSSACGCVHLRRNINSEVLAGNLLKLLEHNANAYWAEIAQVNNG